MALQMSKQHLDLFALARRFFECVSGRKSGNTLAHTFMSTDGQGSGRTLGALRLERTTGAIRTFGAVDKDAVIAALTNERQQLAARADKGVACRIEGKILAREDAIGLLRTVKHGDMRFDSALH